MSPVLVIGATRSLGASLVRQYAARPGTVVYGTTRSSTTPSGFPSDVKWLCGIDLMEPGVGDALAGQLGDSQPLSAVVGQPCVGS